MPKTEYRCPVQSPVTSSSKQCTGTDGYYPDLSSGCRNFFYCKAGHRVNYACPPNMVFNRIKCVPNAHFTCPSAFSCKGKINGFYQDVLSNCRQYFYCNNGRKYEYICPEEQVYNGRTCVPASTFTFPSHTDDRDCVGKHTGFYPDPKSLCQSFFSCQDGVKLQTLTCPQSQVFNGVTCVPFYSYSCPYPWELPHADQSQAEMSVPMVKLEAETKSVSRFVKSPSIITLNEDTFSDVKDLIQVRHKLSAQNQPNKLIRDSTYTNYMVTFLSALSACLNLPNGSYADIESNCQRYLECRERPQWSVCPTSQLFNPTSGKCEQPRSFTCPTHHYTCQHLPDGSYGHLESQCRVFYFCHSKHLHLLSACPEGQAFSQVHGECQAREKVVCGTGSA